MDKRYDITVEVLNNDIAWAPSDEQHVIDTINGAPGWWKEYPGDGVNIRNYLNSSGQEQVFSRSISVNLRADLYIVEGPPIVATGSDGKLYINPNVTI